MSSRAHEDRSPLVDVMWAAAAVVLVASDLRGLIPWLAAFGVIFGVVSVGTSLVVPTRRVLPIPADDS